MIPGFLAKSWYVTRCSINFSGAKGNTGANLTRLEDSQQHISADLTTLTFGNLAGVALSPAKGHADIHVVGGGI